MPDVHAGQDVRFDFDGSLRLMRRLWALADQLESMANGRVKRAEWALTDWLGRYAEDFAQRTNTDVESLQRVITGFRQHALNWAECWLLAVNTQNKVNFAKAADQFESNENILQKGHDFFWGHDKRLDQPPADQTVAPSPPNFYPTAELVTYTIT